MKKNVLKNSNVKVWVIVLSLIMSIQVVSAQQKTTNDDKTKQELINLSKQKWQWMAERNVDSLNVLFHEEAVFVHIGGAMNRA
jgi:hypothetical protein